jgi:hypothetical protein
VTASLVLLIALENGVLRRMFGRERNDLQGDWRKVRNEEMLCSPTTKTNGLMEVKLLAF